MKKQIETEIRARAHTHETHTLGLSPHCDISEIPVSPKIGAPPAHAAGTLEPWKHASHLSKTSKEEGVAEGGMLVLEPAPPCDMMSHEAKA